MCSSRMRRTSISIHQSATKTTVFGRAARKQMSDLIAEREKFAPHLMVSAGVCFGGKGQLHFVDEKAKVDAAYYVGRLLPELIADCKRLLPAGLLLFAISFSKTAHQRILFVSRKIDSMTIALVSLKRTNGPQILRI